jgi:hypothetical protein
MLVEQAGISFALGLYCTAHSVREIVIELARVSRFPIALSLEAQARHTCIRKGSLCEIPCQVSCRYKLLLQKPLGGVPGRRANHQHTVSLSVVLA